MSEILNISLQTDTVIRILLLAFLAFMLSMVVTPLYTHIAYKNKWWKRQRTEASGGGSASVYQKLHAAKHRHNIPTMAGVIFVFSISFVTLVANLDRGETWLPLAGMIGSAIIGFVDDWINIRGQKGGIAGMRAKIKFFLHSVVALAGGWWFYAKLDVSSINIGFTSLEIGALVIILFWFVVVATANAVNITDGLDGLAGGLLVSSFTAKNIFWPDSVLRLSARC
jgi:phospho-N-acetylmuramoyl-pentapeptide-transferase